MTPPATPTFPSAPVKPDLRRAFQGILRLTIGRLLTLRHALLFGALVVLLGVIGWAMLSVPGGPARYLNWAVDSYFTFLVPVVAFINAGGAFRDDLKASTVDYVLTRPIPRPAFLVFKFLGHVAAAQVEFLIAAALLIALGAWHGAPGIGPAIPLLLAGQVLLVLAFAAFGFLAAAITTRYVIIGLVYGAVVEVGVGNIPTQLSRLSLTHQVRAVLQPLTGAAPLDGGATVLGTTTVLLAFTVVALAAAAVVFQLREFGGSGDN